MDLSWCKAKLSDDKKTFLGISSNVIFSHESFDFFGLLNICSHLFSKQRPSEPMLSLSRNVCPSVCLSICLSVRLFTFEVLFKRLFAPTSRSRMFNNFRGSESLGKSNGKMWSLI